MRKLTYLEAIKEAIEINMIKNKNIIIYGEGSDPALGSFYKHGNLAKRFGNNRVFDSPLSEEAMQGIAIGCAINGTKAIMVWFRLDFILLGLDQILNHASKMNYIYNINCPLVIKTTIGVGWGQGPNHSQAFHSILAHFPGLKVVLPSNAYDAKGLMNSAIKSNSPVIFIEHKGLFNEKCRVPKINYCVEIGKAKIIKYGKDITIVSYSYMTKEVLKACSFVNYDCEIIDMISSYPLDIVTVAKSVKKTKKLIIADVDWNFLGIGSEIIALLCKKLGNTQFSFERVGLPHVSHPTSHYLEKYLYPDYKVIIKKINALMRKKR
jgi:pyruvate/2-oxoglutarate/acetoin dehydrogenase E1 component